MSAGPKLHYSLPARTAGSFGSSALGRVAEALTLTWFRFEVFLMWLLMILVIAAAAEDNPSPLLLLVLSPVTALGLWILLKLTGWVFYFMPGMGKLWGWGRLIFLWAFSRLVVQPAPTIDMPVWANTRPRR
jgi:hypothetical protein